MRDTDSLPDKLLRACDRFGISQDVADAAIARFEVGRREYGEWNHLSLKRVELLQQAREEVLDIVNYLALIPWSQAYHSTLPPDGTQGWIDESDADDAVDADLLELALDLCNRIEADLPPTFRAQWT